MGSETAHVTMETSSLKNCSNTAASRLNQEVMKKLTEAMKENPEVNLLSIFPPTYQDHISPSSATLSELGELNRRTIDRLRKRFVDEPEVNLSKAVGLSYRIQYDGHKLNRDQPKAEEPNCDTRPDDVFKRLDNIETADITSPLSNATTTLLGHYTGSTSVSTISPQGLASALKEMFRKSENLYELPVRGAVFKCNEEVVAKVVANRHSNSEYQALQYIAVHAPDIPAPRPHGRIKLGRYTVMFMSYIPSMTLTDAWPKMSHHQKLSIQCQLDSIFCNLRRLKQQNGRALGSLDDHIAKDAHRESYKSNRPIITAAEFEDWKFSISPFATRHYTAFLRSFLPPPATESVFTHGDLRPDNIMVDKDCNGEYVVTGIIDWEDCGFYPDYHESTKTTNLLNSNLDSDWYQYLPSCIAPLSFSTWWLVDRLWDRNILYAH